MAEIDVEKEGPSIWPWIIGIIVLALIIWAIASMVGGEEPEPAAVVDAPIEQPAVDPPPAEPVAVGEEVVISEVIASPATFTGETVRGEVVVADVATDRLFWIADQGQRLAVVILEGPIAAEGEAGRNEPLNIQPGQTLRIQEALVRDPTFIGELPAEISQQTRDLLQDVEAFLTVESGAIEILGMPGEQGLPGPDEMPDEDEM